MSTMKILLPYRDSCDREITSSVVSGGGEQFCKLINKNFINVEVLKVPSKAEQSWSVKEKYDLQKKIVETAEDVNADIIILLCIWFHLSISCAGVLLVPLDISASVSLFNFSPFASGE